jgi:thiol:disulfide interchange protein DsbA
MQRRDLATLLAAGGLLGPSAWAQGGPIEGKQYRRLATPLPTAAGKVEVVEFFFYKCPHCFAFDPRLEAWLKQQAADVSFRRVPVGAQLMLKLHQRMYYALEAIGKTHDTHAAIFDAFHRKGVDATDEAGVKALVAKLGVDPTKFQDAFASFGVQSKMAQGQRLAEAAGVENVPSLMVGGRFVTSPSMAGLPGQAEDAQGQAALVVAESLIQMTRKGT